MRKLIVLMFLSLNVSASCVSALMQIIDSEWTLYHAAKKGLAQNIVELSSGKYLSAGPHQFKTFWTRDFAWSNRGLMEIGREDVLKSQIEVLLKFREDGLVPKALDSMSPPKRALTAGWDYLTKGEARSLPIGDPLKAYFKDENGSVAIDSNILILKAALEYVNKSGDTKWWRKIEDGLVDIYRYYDRHLQDGLIYQMKHSDWQDSVKRVGKTSYTNTLYYLISRNLKDNPRFNITDEFLTTLKKNIIDKFYDDSTGLIKSLDGEEYVSLDTNLIMLDMDFWQNPARAKKHYQALVNSPFFERNGGLAGWNTFPNYPWRWRSLASKVVVNHYHDELYWSWLMAYTAKISRKFGDEANAKLIVDQLKSFSRQFDEVGEVFTDGKIPYKSWAVKSETPFSWGSAFTLDLLGN